MELKPASDAKEAGAGLGCLILLCFVGFAIDGGYEWLDSIGWISHREETVISARNDWLVGESKECSSPTLNSHGAALLGEQIGYAMSSVSCDDGPEHKCIELGPWLDRGKPRIFSSVWKL